MPELQTPADFAETAIRYSECIDVGRTAFLAYLTDAVRERDSALERLVLSKPAPFNIEFATALEALRVRCSIGPSHGRVVDTQEATDALSLIASQLPRSSRDSKALQAERPAPVADRSAPPAPVPSYRSEAWRRLIQGRSLGPAGAPASADDLRDLLLEIADRCDRLEFLFDRLTRDAQPGAKQPEQAPVAADDR